MTSHSLQGEICRGTCQAEPGPRLVLLPVTVPLALSLSPGACPQRSTAGSVSGVLGAQVEMLPGISILPL